VGGLFSKLAPLVKVGPKPPCSAVPGPTTNRNPTRNRASGVWAVESSAYEQTLPPQHSLLCHRAVLE